MPKSVDPKVYDLAALFCRDIDGGHTEEQVQDLAENIQDAIETWFQQE